MGERKLASIQKVIEIRPIENSDNIELIQVNRIKAESDQGKLKL